MEHSSIHTQKADDMQKRMQSLGNVYKMYAKTMCRYFCAYTHDQMAAEDMTHDLFLKLAHVDVINIRTARALLFTTASYMVIDSMRHKKYVRKYETDAVAGMERFDSFSVERKIDSDNMTHIISMQLDNMSPKQADVYTLYFREGKSAKKIACELNISSRTVEGHIYNSRKQVKKKLLQVFSM